MKVSQFNCARLSDTFIFLSNVIPFVYNTKKIIYNVHIRDVRLQTASLYSRLEVYLICVGGHI